MAEVEAVEKIDLEGHVQPLRNEELVGREVGGVRVRWQHEACYAKLSLA